MKLTGENRSTRGKTCPSATFSTINPTWTDPGLNPGLHSGRPATDRHGTESFYRSYHRSHGQDKLRILWTSNSSPRSQQPVIIPFSQPVESIS
jgi:hypothetical protein